MEHEEEPVIEKQSLTISSVFFAAIHAIIGYIVVYFFKPIWEKIIEILDSEHDYWNNK